MTRDLRDLLIPYGDGLRAGLQVLCGVRIAFKWPYLCHAVVSFARFIKAACEPRPVRLLFLLPMFGAPGIFPQPRLIHEIS